MCCAKFGKPASDDSLPRYDVIKSRYRFCQFLIFSRCYTPLSKGNDPLMINKTSSKTFDVKVTWSRQKIEIFAVERPADHLIEAEGLSFDKNKLYHRNQRGRLPLVYSKNTESLPIFFSDFGQKQPKKRCPDLVTS